LTSNVFRQSVVQIKTERTYDYDFVNECVKLSIARSLVPIYYDEHSRAEVIAAATVVRFCGDFLMSDEIARDPTIQRRSVPREPSVDSRQPEKRTQPRLSLGLQIGLTHKSDEWLWSRCPLLARVSTARNDSQARFCEDLDCSERGPGRVPHALSLPLLS